MVTPLGSRRIEADQSLDNCWQVTWIHRLEMILHLQAKCEVREGLFPERPEQSKARDSALQICAMTLTDGWGMNRSCEIVDLF